MKDFLSSLCVFLSQNRGNRMHPICFDIFFLKGSGDVGGKQNGKDDFTVLY